MKNNVSVFYFLKFDKNILAIIIIVPSINIITSTIYFGNIKKKD